MAWEVIDVNDLRRHRREREGHRRIEWPVSLRTRMKFRSLLYELIDLESYPHTLETEVKMAELREEIRGLPGFPRRYDPDKDLIVPVTTSVQR